MHTTDTVRDLTLPEKLATTPTINETYSPILEGYRLPFTPKGQQFQVGEITANQGWILHLSLVLWQIREALQVIIPILIEEEAAFKVPIDSGVAKSILEGTAGLRQIGKIIRIYPSSDTAALHLAHRLIPLLDAFKGPRVPTDIHLGTVVYTRYGSFQPGAISSVTGLEEKYMKNEQDQLCIDPEAIPFKYPNGIPWPFTSIAPPALPRPQKLLNHFFKPTQVLKASPRGNVFKGLYHKSLFRVKTCVIKQGIMHMASDETGREIYDRLLWQKHLHANLAGVISIPRIYDFFEQDGDHYLAMEFIDGKSLMEHILEVNFNRKSWFELTAAEKSITFGYLDEIVSILGRLHQLGYVHRDIAPGNFLIDKGNKLYLIDIELAYSFKERTPLPPFELGTPGFMSPEQRVSAVPTIQEDIYGLGALMLVMFTGLSPIKFRTEGPEELLTNLRFFLRDTQLAETVASCLSPHPSRRPSLAHINEMIIKCATVKHTPASLQVTSPDKFHNNLYDGVEAGIQGLVAPIMALKNNIWYFHMAKQDYLDTVGSSEFIRYPGMANGISGVLYVISRCHQCGFDVSACQEAFDASWRYLKETYCNNADGLPVGLYNGLTGLGLAAYEARKAVLLPETDADLDFLKVCLFRKSDFLTMDAGIAGQGTALLHCEALLPAREAEVQLREIAAVLLNAQQKDGSWNLTNTKLKGISNPLGLSSGISGITWFLLAYGERFDHAPALQAANRSLQFLLTNTDDLKDLFRPKRVSEIVKNARESTDLRCGILMTILKAYQVFGKEHYRSAVEAIMLQYPGHPVDNNFSQANGLTGLGEVYLEGWKVFQDDRWQKRAQWIAEVLLHTAQKDQEGRAWWLIDESYTPTADLMSGTSGILHFLLRSYMPEKIGYRLLS